MGRDILSEDCHLGAGRQLLLIPASKGGISQTSQRVSFNFFRNCYGTIASRDQPVKGHLFQYTNPCLDRHTKEFSQNSRKKERKITTRIFHSGESNRDKNMKLNSNHVNKSKNLLSM